MSKEASGRKDRMANQSGGTETFSSKLAYIYIFLFFKIQGSSSLLFQWASSCFNPESKYNHQVR